MQIFIFDICFFQEVGYIMVITQTCGVTVAQVILVHFVEVRILTGLPFLCRNGTLYVALLRCRSLIGKRLLTFCSLIHARRLPPSAQVRMRINFGSSRAKVEQ